MEERIVLTDEDPLLEFELPPERLRNSFVEPGDLLALLNGLVIQLASITDLHVALHAILDTALQIYPIDAGGIYVRDRATGGLRLAVHRGLSPEFVRISEFYGPDAPNTQLIAAGQPVYATYAQVLGNIDVDVTDHEELRALGVVPIVYGGSAIGALNVASHLVDEMPADARKVVETLAAHVAGALSRIAAEQARNEDRESLASLFSATQDMVLVVDAGGTLVHWNEAVERSLGYTNAELRGRTFVGLHPPELAAEAAAAVQRVVGSSGGHGVVPMLARDSTRIPVETRATRGQWQGRAATFCISRDVSARLRIEERLRQAQKMEALGSLAGGISHDLNNVLCVIRGFAEATIADLEDGENPGEDLRGVIDSIGHGADLVKRIMAFARKTTPQLCIMDVNKEVGSAVRMLRRLLPQSIEVEFEASAAPATSRVEAGGLTTALLNLGVNARDAMPERGKLRFCVGRGDYVGDELEGPGRRGRFVRVSAEDTGQGMDDATMSHLFEPFYTTKEVGKGNGFGLAMVYATVRNAGGEVRCRSALGKGTQFDLYLPAAV